MQMIRRGAAREQPLDVAERARAGTDRRCASSRRAAPGGSRGDGAVDVGVDEMRVHDVGAEPPRQPRRAATSERGSRSRGAGSRVVRDAERVELRVERIRRRPSSRPTNAASMPRSRERRQQRQQVALGAADAAHPVDVQRPSRARRSAATAARPPRPAAPRGCGAGCRAGSPTARGSASCRRRPSPSASRRRAGAARAPRKRRGSRASPARASDVERDHEDRLERPCRAKPLERAVPGVSSLDRHDAGSRASRPPAAASFAFSPGWSRQKSPHLALVEAHLRALVDRRSACRSARQVRGELGPGRRAGQLGHLVDPVAVREDS